MNASSELSRTISAYRVRRLRSRRTHQISAVHYHLCTIAQSVEHNNLLTIFNYFDKVFNDFLSYFQTFNVKSDVVLIPVRFTDERTSKSFFLVIKKVIDKSNQIYSK